MKAQTLQILWHGKDPILSLDFHHSGLLATAGSDRDVKLWNISLDADGKPVASYHSSLSHHSMAVNIVRFSPSGDLLASGADGGEILLWKPVPTAENSQCWKVFTTMARHQRDILDLSWSPDGAHLLSGSVDNTSIVWDTSKGAPRRFLEDHVHYVQGVAWDPLGLSFATCSCDRTCRIYGTGTPSSQHKKGRDRSGGEACLHVLTKRDASFMSTSVPGPSRKEADGGSVKPAPAKHNMFLDETVPSFFRRLAWSPDGACLVVPAGIYKHTLDTPAINTAYIFSRKDWSKPVMHLPGSSKPIIAVRFCPVAFKLRKQLKDAPNQRDPTTAFRLPYRYVFAIASLDSLFIYDTERKEPLAILAGLHYAAITDLSWSLDAQYLAISSQDGYCTLVHFKDGELGEPLAKEELPTAQQPTPAHPQQPEPTANPRKKGLIPDAVPPLPSSPPPHDHTPAPAATPASDLKTPAGPAPAPPQLPEAGHTRVDMARSLKRGFDTSFLSRDETPQEKKPRRITPMATAFAVHSQWESGSPAPSSSSVQAPTKRDEAPQQGSRNGTAAASAPGPAATVQKKANQTGSAPRRIAPIAVAATGPSTDSRPNGGKAVAMADGSRGDAVGPEYGRAEINVLKGKVGAQGEERREVKVKWTSPVAVSAGAEGQGTAVQGSSPGPAQGEGLCESAPANQVTSKPRRITPISMEPTASKADAEPNQRVSEEPAQECASNHDRAAQGLDNRGINMESNAVQGETDLQEILEQPAPASVEHVAK